jgi:hypothetical protein
MRQSFLWSSAPWRRAWPSARPSPLPPDLAGNYVLPPMQNRSFLEALEQTLPHSGVLGKGHKALGKVFIECHTWHISHDKILVGKEDFAECFISGTRQSFCLVLKNTQQRMNRKKKLRRNSKKNFFFTRGGPHRPVPARVHRSRKSRHFSRATRPAGFELATSASRVPPLPLHHSITCV